VHVSHPGSEEPRVDPEQGTVLLVEDDPDAAQVAMGMLHLLGYEIEHVENAHQALAALAERAPELVVLDICLPDLDGADVLTIMRRLREHAQTPVLAVSAVYPVDNVLVRRMMELGLVGYLPKPFKFAQLKSVLEPVRGRPDPRRTAAGRLPVHVRAEAHYAGGVSEAVLEDSDAFSVTARLDFHPALGEEVGLILFGADDDRLPRLRLFTLVLSVVHRQDGRYRLGVDVAVPEEAWDDLRRTLGRYREEAASGVWRLDRR